VEKRYRDSRINIDHFFGAVVEKNSSLHLGMGKCYLLHGDVAADRGKIVRAGFYYHDLGSAVGAVVDLIDCPAKDHGAFATDRDYLPIPASYY
jgi:hypothetical protein